MINITESEMEFEIKKCQRRQDKGQDMKNMVKILALVLFVFFTFVIKEVYANPCEEFKGCCREEVWTCPNCGYENYVSIKNCGLCGEKKPKS